MTLIGVILSEFPHRDMMSPPEQAEMLHAFLCVAAQKQLHTETEYEYLLGAGAQVDFLMV